MRKRKLADLKRRELESLMMHVSVQLEMTFEQLGIEPPKYAIMLANESDAIRMIGNIEADELARRMRISANALRRRKKAKTHSRLHDDDFRSN